ncbi:MAG: transglycosylase domain-containing protein [Luteolibacter sp.]
MATTTSKNIRRPGGKKRFYKSARFWLTTFLLLVIFGTAGGIFAIQYTEEYRKRAETYDLERINDLEIPSLILDRNDKVIGRFYVQNRSVIPISQIPENFIQALLSSEDSRFYTHKGVDFMGIVRAAYLNVKGNKQGASTITQQLARNAYDLKAEAVGRKETTMQRKFVEAFLARRIEERYSKREILEFYLNRIYFGSGFYGIRSASLGYYGKEPMQMTTDECASLVTLIKNPTQRSPLNNPKANLEGRNYVLGRMREEKFITRDEYARLVALPLSLDPKPIGRGTTHFYERIADAVGKALGEEGLASGGFKIHTTILAEAQTAAQKALRESLSRAEAHSGYTRARYENYRRDGDKLPEYLQGAVLMVDHETGEVLAYVGGRDYAQAPYDIIQSGKRPLGTAFFPFIYAAGFNGSLTPATLVEDEPMDNRAVMVGGREGILGEWGMEIPNPTYEGNITTRRALETSKISATVRFANLAGLQQVRDTAVACGLPLKDAQLLPRLSVGWEEVNLRDVVSAMSVFPMGGKSGVKDLIYLDRIENAEGRVIYRQPRPQIQRRQAIQPSTAWQVHSMMAGSLVRGSAEGATEGLLEKPFYGAAKGGTTPDFCDAWFVGYNKRITCGVWTGFLQPGGAPIYPGAFSRDLAMPVWQATMNAAAPSFNDGPISPPAGIVEVPICKVSGQRGTQFCQEHVSDPMSGKMRSKSTTFVEYFRQGTDRLPFCAVHSGATADSITPEAALSNLPALDAIPIRPTAPFIIGEDPYHTEVPSFAVTSHTSGLIRRRSNVLDSLDLGNEEESIPLRRPGRLEIHDD